MSLALVVLFYISTFVLCCGFCVTVCGFICSFFVRRKRLSDATDLP